MRYWNPPLWWDVSWIEANPDYPDWQELADRYRAGEIEPLVAALRRAEYAPPPEILGLIADVLARKFKPPTRGKGNALLTAVQRRKIASLVSGERDIAGRLDEQRVSDLLRETLERPPTPREVTRTIDDLRQRVPRLVKALARIHGVSEAAILKTASRPRKRR